MKKILVCAALILSMAVGAKAQGGNGSGSGSKSMAGSSAGGGQRVLHTAKRTTVKKTASGKKKVTKTVPLREEKMYPWKDGQSATPTGHEATGTGAASPARKKGGR